MEDVINKEENIQNTEDTQIIENSIEENNIIKESNMEEINKIEELVVEEKHKRTRRTRAEMEAEKLAKAQEIDENTGVNVDGELAKELSNGVETKEEVNTHAEEELYTIELEKDPSKQYTTEHKFAPNDHVFVAEFGQKRDSEGFTRLVNSYKFYPREGEIERVILTEHPIKVQYKLKNRAGSLFDEEDVCYTEEDAKRLCEYKNRR